MAGPQNTRRKVATSSPAEKKAKTVSATNNNDQVVVAGASTNNAAGLQEVPLLPAAVVAVPQVAMHPAIHDPLLAHATTASQTGPLHQQPVDIAPRPPFSPQLPYHAVRKSIAYKGPIILFNAQDIQQLLWMDPTAICQSFSSLSEAETWLLRKDPPPAVVDLTTTTTAKRKRGRPEGDPEATAPAAAVVTTAESLSEGDSQAHPPTTETQKRQSRPRPRKPKASEQPVASDIPQQQQQQQQPIMAFPMMVPMTSPYVWMIPQTPAMTADGSPPAARGEGRSSKSTVPPAALAAMLPWTSKKDKRMEVMLREIKKMFGHVDLLSLEHLVKTTPATSGSAEEATEEGATGDEQEHNQMEVERPAVQTGATVEESSVEAPQEPSGVSLDAILKEAQTNFSTSLSWCRQKQREYENWLDQKHKGGPTTIPDLLSKEGSAQEAPITDAQVHVLKDIGLVGVPNTPIFDRIDHGFQAKIQLLKEFRQIYGTLEVPSSYDNIKPPPDQPTLDVKKFHSLSKWICSIRRVHYKRFKKDGKSMYTEQHYQQLLDLGFDLEPPRGMYHQQVDDTKWNQKFRELEAFTKKHGDPNLAICKDYNEPKLGAWIAAQRRWYKKAINNTDKDKSMNPEWEAKIKNRMLRLMDLGVKPKPSQEYVPWDIRCQRWKEFVTAHPDVKLSMCSKDPQIADVAQFQEREKWKYIQRVRGDRHWMSDERFEKLRLLGFPFPAQVDPFKPTPPKKYTWEERYEQLVKFFEENGHSVVPQATAGLGGWVHDQRYYYTQFLRGEKTRLTAERLAKLNQVNFVFKVTGNRRARQISRVGSPTIAPAQGGKRKTFREQSQDEEDEDDDDSSDVEDPRSRNVATGVLQWMQPFAR